MRRYLVEDCGERREGVSIKMLLGLISLGWFKVRQIAKKDRRVAPVKDGFAVQDLHCRQNIFTNEGDEMKVHWSLLQIQAEPESLEDQSPM
jgi:hypothetical protein